MISSLKIFSLLLVVTASCFTSTEAGSDEIEAVILQTSLGTIEGKIENFTNQEFVSQHYIFRGIPYALAPVGDLRLADPVDATAAWSGGHLDATRFGNICPQFKGNTKSVVGDEDCLYLNIFTPVTRKSDSSGRLPVLVFIHGGGFVIGSPLRLDGGRLASQNIILVTFSYRIGALGFLSTEDETIPGNFGILDQISALRWVKRHISEFGGDPDKVTIGGFSAGAASAHMLLLSPHSEGLFQRMLIVSGSAYCPRAFQRNPRQTVEEYAEEIMCSGMSSNEFKQCLSSKTKEELVIAQVAVMNRHFLSLPFAPIIDANIRNEPFFPHAERKLKPINSAPVLIGEMSEEGIYYAIDNILKTSEPSNPEVVYDQLVPEHISGLWFRTDEAEKVAEIAKTLYYSEKSKTSLDVLFEEMSEAMSDYLIHECICKSALELTRNGNPVYTYIYSHREPQTPLWDDNLYGKAKSLGMTSSLLSTGTTHGDNLRLVFSQSLNATTDEYMASVETKNWVNFVANGTPSHSEEIWPKVQPGSPVLFYNVSLEPHMQRRPYKSKESKFWLETIPFILKNNGNSLSNGFILLQGIIGALMTSAVFYLMHGKF